MLECIPQVGLITWFSFIQQELWESVQQVYFLPTVCCNSVFAPSSSCFKNSRQYHTSFFKFRIKLTSSVRCSMAILEKYIETRKYLQTFKL